MAASRRRRSRPRAVASDLRAVHDMLAQRMRQAVEKLARAPRRRPRRPRLGATWRSGGSGRAGCLSRGGRSRSKASASSSKRARSSSMNRVSDQKRWPTRSSWALASSSCSRRRWCTSSSKCSKSVAARVVQARADLLVHLRLQRAERGVDLLGRAALLVDGEDALLEVHAGLDACRALRRRRRRRR